MRIALAQINPTVGDLRGNFERVAGMIHRAAEGGANLVVFPELCLTGYPPRDLLLKRQFVEDNLQCLRRVAEVSRGITTVVGYAEWNASQVGRPLHNAAAVVRDGKIISRHYKTLLPTYDVFDESRYFEPGPRESRSQIVKVDQTPIGLSICEDLWNDERLIARRLYHENPIAELGEAGARVLVNCSASPFVMGKHEFRKKLFSAQAARWNVPLVYVNQVGGNDELVFDGNSVVFDGNGRLVAQLDAFREDLRVVDLPGESGHTPAVERDGDSDLRDVHDALLLGLRDYVRKCGFKSVVLGLSGGIDSALTAALAVRALGPEKVLGVAMPSRFSSPGSVTDARALANNLGIELREVPIGRMHDAFEETMRPIFGDLPRDITEENMQARIRGAILMAFSNKFGRLLLTTGNKSELAVGYCTLYGDMCGGLAVISDVPKTMVWALSRWINRSAGREVIPQSSIEKVPSAELRPNQTDQDSLPPYELLDEIIERYVEQEMPISQIIADGFEEPLVRRVVRLIDRSEYKRRQAAPGLKVTSRAFGVGRRMPIAQDYEHGQQPECASGSAGHFLNQTT
jgi:NAD+ synthetase